MVGLGWEMTFGTPEGGSPVGGSADVLAMVGVSVFEIQEQVQLWVLGDYVHVIVIRCFCSCSNYSKWTLQPMSAMGTAPSETEWDFWEFVSCALCHLLFVPNDKGPPAVPFWLTECGHIVCNNHLSGCCLLSPLSRLTQRT